MAGCLAHEGAAIDEFLRLACERNVSKLLGHVGCKPEATLIQATGRSIPASPCLGVRHAANVYRSFTYPHRMNAWPSGSHTSTSATRTYFAAAGILELSGHNFGLRLLLPLTCA